MQVATHGENTGYEVPCLIVAAKDDLDQCAQALQESTRVSILAFNSVGIISQLNPYWDRFAVIYSYLYIHYRKLLYHLNVLLGFRFTKKTYEQ